LLLLLLILQIFILIYSDIFIKISHGYNLFQIYRNNSKGDISNIKEETKIIEFNYLENQLIAHAGGEINGSIYTNSLEALNNSYKNGIKYFELDIRLTSDGHLIAMHDFQQWKKFTGYNKDTMPTLKEFMDLKILNRYTPLDINSINNWFEIHKDTILITDKINNPLLLSNNFKI